MADNKGETYRELLGRAAELVPALKQRAARTEESRNLPRETVDDFHASGVLRAAQPKRYGGYDIDYGAVLDIAAELGRGCGSTAWCYSIWASHNWAVGMFPLEAQDEYWAESPDTLSSTSLNPSNSSVEAAAGGYRLSGRWQFSSGCDYADWVMLAGNAAEGLLYMLLPKSDYLIDDTWRVSGLRGTGSKDIVVEDSLVPQHRTVLQAELRDGSYPGRRIHNTPNFRIPLGTMFSYTLAAPILGMAQGALEEFESHTAARVNYTSGERMAESAPVHVRIAQAEAEVHAARLIMENDGREVFERARRDENPSLPERARIRRNQAYVARLSVSAVDRLFQASGGHAIFDGSPLQRFHRDAHAAAHHFSLSWDTVAEEYGRIMLGLEPKNPGRI